MRFSCYCHWLPEHKPWIILCIHFAYKDLVLRCFKTSWLETEENNVRRIFLCKEEITGVRKKTGPGASAQPANRLQRGCWSESVWYFIRLTQGFLLSHLASAEVVTEARTGVWSVQSSLCYLPAVPRAPVTTQRLVHRLGSGPCAELFLPRSFRSSYSRKIGLGGGRMVQSNQ